MIEIPSKNISKLDLSNKNLKVFPSQIFELKNLKKLNLSGNKISIVPKEIESLKYLESLDLSNNNITNFYSKICYLKSLKILNLNNNKLKTLPNQIENLKKLERLQLANNQIEKLPLSFGNLKNLRELNISKNLFTKFPIEILKNSKLKSLWINNLELKSFPVLELSKLEHLKSLYCFGLIQNNKVVDNIFYNLSKIKGNSIGSLIMNANVQVQKKELALIESNNQKGKIFISYSHKDKSWLEKVQTNLKVLTFNDYEFDLWDDSKLAGGDKWKDEISKALETASIAILLVSTDFLASDFIRQIELPKILQNAQNNGTKVLPLILGHCLFTKDKLSMFQSVNEPNKPLSSLSQSEAEKQLVRLTERVMEILKSN